LAEQPDLWRELQGELLSAFPDPSATPDVVELEKIPLLEACVKEATRVAVPIRGKHPREVPEGGWKYKEYFLPAKVRPLRFALASSR